MNNIIEAKLKSLERRIAKLEERIARQKIGPEVETSKKILAGLKRKYEALKRNNNLIIPEATTTSKNNVSEEELIQRLGAIYWIFGPSYEEEFSFKKYRIDFIQILPNPVSSCILKVKVEIYENDKPLATNDAVITFWKGFRDSTDVDDLGFSCNENTKYDNCHWFECLSYNLAKTWNIYFRDVPLITARNSGLLESRETRAYSSYRGY